MKLLIFPMLLLLTTLAFGQDNLGFSGYNHVALQVEDIQKSTKFYREIVGLTSIAVPDNLKKIRSWFDMGKGQQLHLLAGRTEKISHDRNGSHIALFVKSITTAEAFLKKHNMNYHKQNRFDNVVQIYFSDPDGYLIEINESN